MKKYIKLFLSSIFLCFTLISCSDDTIDTAKTIEIKDSISLGEAINTYYETLGETKIKWEYIKEDNVIHTIGNSTGVIFTIPTTVSGSVVSITPDYISCNKDENLNLAKAVTQEIYKKRFYNNWSYKGQSDFVWTPKEFEDEGWDVLLVSGRFPTIYKPTYLNAISKYTGDIEGYKKSIEYYKTDDTYTQDTLYYLDNNTQWKGLLLKAKVNISTQESTIGGALNTNPNYWSFGDTKNIDDEILKVIDKYDYINIRGKYKEK